MNQLWIKILVGISLFNFVVIIGIAAIGTMIRTRTTALLPSDLQPSETNQQINEPSPLPAQKPKTTKTTKIATTQKATTSSTQSNPMPQSTPDTRCIVVIDGMRFNVTKFRADHSGGDIFQCGTDMTQIFRSRHDASYLTRMQQYKI